MIKIEYSDKPRIIEGKKIEGEGASIVASGKSGELLLETIEVIAAIAEMIDKNFDLDIPNLSEAILHIGYDLYKFRIEGDRFLKDRKTESNIVDFIKKNIYKEE